MIRSASDDFDACRREVVEGGVDVVDREDELGSGNGLIYECWYAIDYGWRPYRRGSRLVRGWRDVVSWTGVAPPLAVLVDAIIDRHHHVDFDPVVRGYWFGEPGDVVTLGDGATSAKGYTFSRVDIDPEPGDVVTRCDVATSAKGLALSRVDLDPADLIVDRSYWDVHRELHTDVSLDRPAGRRAAESILDSWASSTAAEASGRPGGAVGEQLLPRHGLTPTCRDEPPSAGRSTTH